MSALIDANKKQIAVNRSNLFRAECSVLENKSNAYMARSQVNENQALIAKNYNSAFMGNRQLANQNTEDLFRNRNAIMRNITANSDVEKNFKEAQINKCKIDFLEHRAALNAKVIAVSKQMAAINAEMIKVNSEILAANEEIVQFNAKCIAENSEMLQKGIDASKATPESNALLVKSNADRIAAIISKAAANKTDIQVVLTAAEQNRAQITENSSLIYERRARIMANHKAIATNQELVANFVGRA